MSSASLLRSSLIGHRHFITQAELLGSDTRAVARALVARLADYNSRIASEQSRHEGGAETSRLVILGSWEVLGSICRHGFLNQHMTGWTSGTLANGYRFRAEQQMALACLPYSHHGRLLLPKYAFVTSARLQKPARKFTEHYGPLAFVLKDTVKSRTTFSLGDSLTHYLHNEATKAKRMRPFVYPFGAGFATQPSAGNGVPYAEAQIWGELDLSDVEYVLSPADSRVLEALKETGLPVYSGRHASFLKGERLLPKTRLAPRQAFSSARQAERVRARTAFACERLILESILLGLESEEALIDRFSRLDPDDALPMRDELIGESAWLVAELGARLTTRSAGLLRAALKNPIRVVRHQALLGLAGSAELISKRELGAALHDPAWSVRVLAQLIAHEKSRHRVPALSGFAADLAPGVRRWYNALFRRNLYRDAPLRLDQHET